MEYSSKFVPTLTPTFEQWKCLPSFLTHHETSLQRRFGAVKLIPPSRWIPLIKNPYDLRQIKLYIKQEIIRSSHQSDVFYIQNCEISKRRSMTYDEFKSIAESDTYRVKDSINDNIIDYFWSTISNHISLYVPNIDDSLFAKREEIFNMNDLPSLLKYYPKKTSGVTTPFLHLGMWSSSVGIHIDDYDLITLNYLHHGAPKIWYIIHPSSYTKFEELVNQLKLFSDISLACLSPLQHKTLLIKPSFLRSHSIKYYQIEQKLNELVVIFPGIYHFYFDIGFNLSETIKYALPSWLHFQRRSPRLCSCSISSTMISNLNRRFFTNEILKKFQEKYLMSTSATCIDLSLEEDSQSMIESLDENTIQTMTADLGLQLSDPLYSCSSSTNNNTPTSTDLISTLNTPNAHADLWNLFEQISSPNQSDSTSYHESYSSPIPCHTSKMYSSYFPSYPYSSLRTCIDRRRPKRRKCYGCRRQGHLRKECPYLSHE